MNDMHHTITAFLTDERGAEVTELGIVLALVVAGAVATITLIGPKITQYYSAVNTSLP
jgi:Flp pilus assembly pilin Flp